MSEDISIDILYRIMNRTLKKCAGGEAAPINSEIRIFYNKYLEQQRKGKQLSLFEEQIPTQIEMREMIELCDMLEQYKIVFDPDNDEEKSFPEEFYRKLYQYLTKNKENITQENKELFENLQKVLRRKLPEFKDQEYIKDYIKEADIIYNMKKLSEKQYRKDGKKGKSRDCERYAQYFFNIILNNQELKEINSCPEKIELYEKCLKIVNYLPSEKYGKIAKFKIKIEMNKRIREAALDLGAGYVAMAKHAENEENRFLHAIEMAEFFVGRPRASKRNAYEEWLYK